MIKTVGSVCSGIEAASVAWEPMGYEFDWFSEIADFPSQVLKEKYGNIPNLGDMTDIPSKIISGEVTAPDLICGGTPCQAFSFAGFQDGLNDDRGNLTLKFVDIIDASDKIREQQGKDRSVVFWENVEGVLSDKTNAFGCLVSCLAGLDTPIEERKWPRAGLIRGPKRNVAWRVIDAKFFGLPQQRKRLYVLAGGKDFAPENVLFEHHITSFDEGIDYFPTQELAFEKDGHYYEVFREYTDCLYAAYGTKWNGNAAALNGSLFVVQDGRIRRLSPVECERLMGFPEGYTDLNGAKRTARYTAIGNSWAVPVVKWLGSRFSNGFENPMVLDDGQMNLIDKGYDYYNLGKEIVKRGDLAINCSVRPEHCIYGEMKDIISPDAPEENYISPVACQGIIRRADSRNAKLNERLREVLKSISSTMSIEEIEKRSLRQPRGENSGMAKLTRIHKMAVNE
ncbi:DNA cytosine methyltransferase [Butyrivibrio sp. VCB2001]|uniref:DNA cytosine methyltransferase n=1 Tax=Butyrivibrio sp. VCB2001 TaxID=1280667 RepID=UPI0004092007|nr:DNA cytosine methyltransferase [Butyrivibrio sp. VCB2001]